MINESEFFRLHRWSAAPHDVFFVTVLQGIFALCKCSQQILFELIWMGGEGREMGKERERGRGEESFFSSYYALGCMLHNSIELDRTGWLLSINVAFLNHLFDMYISGAAIAASTCIWLTNWNNNYSCIDSCNFKCMAMSLTISCGWSDFFLSVKYRTIWGLWNVEKICFEILSRQSAHQRLITCLCRHLSNFWANWVTITQYTELYVLCRLYWTIAHSKISLSVVSI